MTPPPESELLFILIREAQSLSMRVVIGGDFNTVVNIGERGMFLAQLVSGFYLKMVNVNENEAPDDKVGRLDPSQPYKQGHRPGWFQPSFVGAGRPSG